MQGSGHTVIVAITIVGGCGQWRVHGCVCVSLKKMMMMNYEAWIEVRHGFNRAIDGLSKCALRHPLLNRGVS